ncbi:MAG TPA: hypothetical protein VGV61_13445 [Thermoanaerobaculia bacterium]|nr:hypothetical protein [Thermoanaerobaculia bacterium]
MRHSLPCRAVIALTAAITLGGTPAHAWFSRGHARVARAAVRALPASVPRFFRDGAWTVGEASVDPDLWKDKTLPALRAAEEPAHFLDWELLQGAPLPPDRWAFAALLAQKRLDSARVGTLPYSVIEGLQRLTLAFAEHRRWPDRADIQQKALVYAGWLAHYAGDLEQPLHTTVHHDGRALPDGSSPKTGIHQLMDGLLERPPLDEAALDRGLRVRVFLDPWAAVQGELVESHALVGRVYQLEPHLRAAWPPTATGVSAATAAPAVAPAVVAFAGERYRAASGFLASLFLTAWKQSAYVQLPTWLERPPASRSGH